MTDNQIKALVDLRDGEWKYGIHLRGRYALPSLKKRGLVFQHFGDGTADQWAISPTGLEAIKQCATIAHLRARPRP